MTATTASRYAAVRERIRALVAGLDDGESATPVPCCPAWTVRDVLAHLAGATSDIRSGALDGVATDEWTARQVAARTDRPVADLLAEWDECVAEIEPTFASFGRMGDILVTDAVTHEQDLRGALGRPGGRDTEEVALALRTFLWGFSRRIDGAGLPPLRVRAGGEEQVVGTGEAAPEVTLAADAFELLRALSGRRHPDQIRAFTWEGPGVERYAALLPGFGPAATPIVE